MASSGHLLFLQHVCGLTWVSPGTPFFFPSTDFKSAFLLHNDKSDRSANKSCDAVTLLSSSPFSSGSPFLLQIGPFAFLCPMALFLLPARNAIFPPGRLVSFSRLIIWWHWPATFQKFSFYFLGSRYNPPFNLPSRLPPPFFI